MTDQVLHVAGLRAITSLALIFNIYYCFTISAGRVLSRIFYFLWFFDFDVALEVRHNGKSGKSLGSIK